MILLLADLREQRLGGAAAVKALAYRCDLAVADGEDAASFVRSRVRHYPRYVERAPRLSITTVSPYENAECRGARTTAQPTDGAGLIDAAIVRPMRADARRNRARVLVAAREAFAEEGVGVSVDEIARGAGVGKATVYRYFPTKEALFEAVVLELLKAIRDREVELLASGDPEAFLTCLAELIELGASDRALLDALSRTSNDIESACMQMYEQLIARMADLLNVAQRANVVRHDICAVDLQPLIIGLLAARAAAGNQSCQWLTRIACDGLRAGEPT